MDQPRAVFQYKDKSMKYISSSHDYQQRKGREIEILEQKLKNMKEQSDLPIGYPRGESGEFKN